MFKQLVTLVRERVRDRTAAFKEGNATALLKRIRMTAGGAATSRRAVALAISGNEEVARIADEEMHAIAAPGPSNHETGETRTRPPLIETDLTRPEVA